MTDPSSGYHGADPQVLQDEGIHLAQQAVQHDQLGRYDMAVFYYSVGFFIYLKLFNQSA